MIQTFTNDDILRYVYNELSDSENEQVENALLYDDELLMTYLDYLEMRSALNKVKLEPSTRCVQNILAYSSTYGASNALVI